MIESLNIKPSYRYERKFVLENISKQEAVHRIKMHPAFFREIYQERRINNVYYDTEHLQFFKDNVIGIADRKKVRVRWYGQTFGFAAKTQLEYKLKEGLLGNKYTFQLPGSEIKTSVESSDLLFFASEAELPEVVKEELKNLQPKLLNSYVRSYFQSADKRFRLTIDEDLSYYRVSQFSSGFVRKAEEKNKLILEMKYAPEHDRLGGKITGAFPFRLSKSSKYVRGIELISNKDYATN